ncbi:hypothetical protein QF035_005390 [Streptomyces umbrinus]|uniref:Uncharacterized protein n=1 Tax=Streptomyces umbrinus TaxID=67370 RepID=A0ABU0SW71_9ACTN|nr:hypothetical protein [Streptomyces umbrinus]MDQ1027808.1 hypothetical protein [Streptomyces umbrinus]
MRLGGDSALRPLALRLLVVRWPVRVTDPDVLFRSFFLRLVLRFLRVLLFLCLLRRRG